MQKQYRRMACVGIFAVATIFSGLQSAIAAENGRSSKITDYGDGIKMCENKDSSGFEMDGGGMRFFFDRKTRTVSFVDENGARQIVTFSDRQPEITIDKPFEKVADAK